MLSLDAPLILMTFDVMASFNVSRDLHISFTSRLLLGVDLIPILVPSPLMVTFFYLVET